VKSLQSSCAHHQPPEGNLYFLTLGVCLAAVAFAVGSGWIILNWREGIKVFLGIIFFGAIVAGLVLNTIFLVREIRRNEQHDSFINAVTHELKTPIASIRLYLQTLQKAGSSRSAAAPVLRTHAPRYRTPAAYRRTGAESGRGGAEEKSAPALAVEFDSLVRECMELARTRHHLQAADLDYRESLSLSI
jgi:two-component system, OmpR family, sensor histidine kinase SenX3